MVSLFLAYLLVLALFSMSVSVEPISILQSQPQCVPTLPPVGLLAARPEVRGCIELRGQDGGIMAWTLKV